MIISVDDSVSKGAQRYEVFTGAGKRREWLAEVEASIVAECWPGRGSVSAVARRHGLDSSQVYAWRKDLIRQFEDQGLAIPTSQPKAAAFVPAVIEPEAIPALSPVPRPRRRRAAPAVVELVWWDGTGLCLMAKRLEAGGFSSGRAYKTV